MTRDTRTAQRRIRVAVVAAFAMLTPALSPAQEGGYARVSMSTAEIYNGNLLSESATRGPESDLFSRFGSAFESGYVSIPFKLVARYELDAERYLDHPQFNRNVARQDGTLSIDWAPISRLAFSVGGKFLQ